MVSSSRPRHPFLDWPAPIAFAHRGGASEAPENTLPAFQNAVDLGYRYLETDVQVTADGVVVAFHDDDLQRTCNRPGKISELPWSEVATARVAGKEPIPRLADLFDAFPDARVNIDCKRDEVAMPLADELLRADVLDRVCVAAFNDRRLRRLRHRLGPDLCTSAGPVELGLLRVAGIAVAGPLAAQVPIEYRGVTMVDEPLRARLPPPRHRGARLDDRPTSRDGPPARPRRRRDHDRRAGDAQGRARPAGRVAVTSDATAPASRTAAADHRDDRPGSDVEQPGVRRGGHGDADGAGVDRAGDADRAAGTRPSPPHGDDGHRPSAAARAATSAAPSTPGRPARSRGGRRRGTRRSCCGSGSPSAPRAGTSRPAAPRRRQPSGRTARAGARAGRAASLDPPVAGLAPSEHASHRRSVAARVGGQPPALSSATTSRRSPSAEEVDGDDVRAPSPLRRARRDSVEHDLGAVGVGGDERVGGS